MKSSEPTILLTGTNSFIGNNFKIFSENRNIQEISLLNITPDLVDFSGIDVVIHLAAIVHVFKNIEPDEYYRINRDLTVTIARQAKSTGVRHFIFLSTIKVYGDFQSSSDPWNESSICNPTDHYGKSKYEAELELQKLADNDFVVSIVRTPVVYGSGVKGNILKLIQLVESSPILPLGKMENKRAYTYTENLVGFLDRIIKLKMPGTFIAMDDHPISTTCLVNYLSKYLGKKVFLFSLPKVIVKIGEAMLPALFARLYGSVILDNTATKDLLNYTPPYSTEMGIRNMIEDYKKTSNKQ